MNLVAKILLLEVYSALLVAYCLWYLATIKAGWSRAWAALPAVVLNLTVPLLLDPETEPLLVTPAAGVLSQASFKLLAWCFNRGPLTLDVTPTQFIAILLMPIIPYEVFTVSGGKRIPPEAGGAPRGTGQLLQDYGKQIGCATVVALILAAYPDMHWFPRHWLYTLCSCMFLGGVFDLLGAAATALLQVPVAPTFNRPWLCNSFADFWARRWNLTITYTMRVLVYEPMIEGQLLAAPRLQPSPPPSAVTPPAQVKPRSNSSSPPQTPHADSGAASDADTADSSSHITTTGLVARTGKGTSSRSVTSVTTQTASQVLNDAKDPPHPARPRPSQLRRLLALQATFMFSGVWHILMFWYNTHTISWRWAVFFIIQAPIVTCEAILCKAWRSAGLPRLPHAFWVVATNAALIAIAGPLFFGPADDTGFAARNLASVKPVLEYMSKVWHASVRPHPGLASSAHADQSQLIGGNCSSDAGSCAAADFLYAAS